MFGGLIGAGVRASVRVNGGTLTTSQRSMATLKDLKMRMDSVSNIAKITSSMKMVSTAKFKQAERALKPARTYGAANQALFDAVELVGENAEAKKPLAILISSDRGLCGGIHSNVSKKAKALLEDRDYQLAIVGDKPKAQMNKGYSEKIVVHMNEIGRTPPTFDEALFVAQQILEAVPDYDGGVIVYNEFVSALAYNTKTSAIQGKETLEWSEKMAPYEVEGDKVLPWYHEFQLANSIYHALKEAAASEQSTRMSAMDNATNNANDMISALNLTYNRTRQAVITRELIEIISGASALE